MVMENRKKDILEMLKKDTSLEMMMETLALSHEELWQLLMDLKKDGYQLQRKHDTRGMTYKLNREVHLGENQPLTLYHKKDHLRFLVLSDLHIGSKDYSKNLVKETINYAKEQGIEHTIITGDFIDGVYKENKDSPFASVKDQISLAKEIYPYERTMHNYILLGNHDYHSVKSEGYDIKDFLERERSDFTILGYRLNYLIVKNVKIALFHPFIKEDIKDFCAIKKQSDIILQGHSHHFKIESNHSPTHIYTPALMKGSHKTSTIGALILDLFWNHYDFDTWQMEYLNFPTGKWSDRETSIIKMKK